MKKHLATFRGCLCFCVIYENLALFYNTATTVHIRDTIFHARACQFSSHIHVRAVLILAGGGDIGCKGCVRRATEMMQQGFVGRVAIAIQGDLRLCLSRYDRVDGRADRCGAEVVVTNMERAALRRLGNTPQEDVVSHRLRPDLAASRQGLAEHGKSAAGVLTGVLLKDGIHGQLVAVFKGRHAVGVKAAAPAYKAMCRLGIFAGALVRDAGIVDVLEGTILDENIVSVLPDLKTVAKADFQFVTPRAAADIFKRTSSYGDMVAMPGQAVDAAVDKAKILKSHAVVQVDQLAHAIGRRLDVRIDRRGVSEGIQIKLRWVVVAVPVGRRLNGLAVKIALCAKGGELPVQGGGAGGLIENQISDVAVHGYGTFPDVRRWGGEPVFLRAYVAGPAKGGGGTFAVGTIRNPRLGVRASFSSMLEERSPRTQAPCP